MKRLLAWTPDWQDRMRANIRYIRILIHEFRWTWLMFCAIILIGGLSFYWYLDPAPDFPECVYLTFTMMFMEHTDPFPEPMLLRVLYFVVPIFSFLVFSEALVRFGVLLFSKANHSKRWIMALTSTYKNHIILCGGGKLGMKILEELLKMGEKVVLIELDSKAPGLDQVRQWNIPVVIGDARNDEELIAVNLEDAKAVVAATDNDMANLEIALDARQLKPGIRVVVRMYDPRIAEKMAREFDIQAIFSTTSLAAPIFAGASGDRTLINSYYVDDQLVQTVKFLIRDNSELASQSIRWLRETHKLVVISYRPKNKSAALFPDPESVLQPGDKVMVAAPSEVIQQLHTLNRDGASV